MESQEFIVLYTHQKMKKSKVWQDGILKVTRCRNKAILYDDKGGCLESFFLKCLEVKPGDDIESDRYLITVEEVRAAEGVGFEQDVIKEAPVLGSRRTVPMGRYLGYQPAGLRRKFPGFKGPRQVPKKVVIVEHGDSAAAFEAEEPGGPVLLSPFPSAPCLFAAVGSNSVNEVPADAENRVVHRDRDGRGPPFSSAASTPSCKINAEMPCEESDFCSPFGSVNKHSDSLLTSEPMKRGSLTSHSSGTPQTHSSGAPQSIRSRAQIVALLKSRPTRTSQEVNHETVERFPPVQPLGGLEVPTHSEGLIAQEEGDDVGTERLHCQRQSGNTVKSKSWWATCLSSQRPSAHSSTVVGDDLERRLQAQGDDTDLMKKFSSLENKDFQRLPLESSMLESSMRVPLVTLPPADGPPDLDPQSHVTGCDRPESSGSPVFNLCEDSVTLPFGLGPEGQREASSFKGCRAVTPGGDSLLRNMSAQSKWLKYQNTPQCNLPKRSRLDTEVTGGFFAESVSGGCFGDMGERQSDAVRGRSLDAVHVRMIRGMLRQQQQGVSHDWVSGGKAPSLNLKQTSRTEETQTEPGGPACREHAATGRSQEISDSELCFPSGQKVKSARLPRRQTCIPAVFQSPAHYKRLFASCLIEHLNILLFGLAQRLHEALAKVDISFYTSSKGEKLEDVENNVPSCHHRQPAKLVMVKKEGPNKGRLFYTCHAPKADQCKFFKWLEEATPGHSTREASASRTVLSDVKSIGLYLRSQKIPFYEECQLLVRKGFDFQRKQYGKLKKFRTVNPEFYNEPKSKLYLKLSRKESSSTYSKDDLWVVSKTIDFELDTFIACSAFFGPSSTNEVELLPLKGYFPSSWPTNTVAHALLVCNASTELAALRNIEDFNPAALPLTRHLLAMCVSRRLPWDHGCADAVNTAEKAHGAPPVTLVQGVFGAGKSYLLAVVVLFFVRLFEQSETPTSGNARPWKLLIASSTNVAVDRVLLGLLSLGFDKFVRVGSVRKIAKPVLPYSLHAGSGNASEQLKELHALMREDLTPLERLYVRRSIEQHKLGTNKTLLRQVCVVGVTCAACLFPCMNDLRFPVVVLDECSQVTEPASLLPIARFECEKLIVVGDPKQLPPTIQGSEAAHENGLEQTLFDRLCLMGHEPVLLRTQYRCHPAISAVANDLFYGGVLVNGVSEADRTPLLAWLPTLCFYSVRGLEQTEGDNSFHNVAEAAFTLKLIRAVLASGVPGSAVGVITLYRAQMCKLCHLLRDADSDPPEVKAVQVSTVDAFQGAEKEIVILSCVRTRQVGFIDSEKRMNVALTRGRRHLLIVGHLACLRGSRLWGRVIQHCAGREDGLQHASQCEPQLDLLLKDYFEKQAEEKQEEKSEKDKSRLQKEHVQNAKSCSRKCKAPGDAPATVR
ncbi:protein ZGRF1 [Pteropus vampyrus]|uniref:5'-3' DNA helicase ZGRF1 n=1 Tax=Pteropus vampyrus TaxID=132908 RepID=A0A6P6BNH6_PTEVA|nr:protein ZGRF1 [Pteropus vampyrus]